MKHNDLVQRNPSHHSCHYICTGYPHSLV